MSFSPVLGSSRSFHSMRNGYVSSPILRFFHALLQHFHSLVQVLLRKERELTTHRNSARTRPKQAASPDHAPCICGPLNAEAHARPMVLGGRMSSSRFSVRNSPRKRWRFCERRLRPVRTRRLCICVWSRRGSVFVSRRWSLMVSSAYLCLWLRGRC